MKQKTFRHTLWEVRRKLQASPKQMARHMKVDLRTYLNWEWGAKIPTVTERKQIIKRAERLLDICGLK